MTNTGVTNTGVTIIREKITLTVAKGILSFILIIMNTLVCFIPIFIFGLLKLLLPFELVLKVCNRLLNATASGWIELNRYSQALIGGSYIQVEGDTVHDLQEWYLLVANHQSWVDIFVLQRVLNGRVPFIKFFIKRELIWLPLVGFAWWVMDFPFMRRYSEHYLKKHPHKKGQDIEMTRKACEKFLTSPISLMNFVEGTRFTPQKYEIQQSPYQYLLRPKAGGLSYALSVMNGQLHKLIDVTIVYPEGIPSFWQYMSGQVGKIQVHIRVLPIASELIGDYQKDPEFKQRFQQWLNQLWLEKDQQIQKMIAQRISH